MSDLKTAAQQALELLGTWARPPARLYGVMDNLRAALAQEQAGSWQDGVLEALTWVAFVVIMGTWALIWLWELWI